MSIHVNFNIAKQSVKYHLILESIIFCKRLPNKQLYKQLLSKQPINWLYFLITDCQTP